ncbi:MAG TPA: DoxX family protein [Terracidiphilus sp.]|nr:DoxX family protein [Terracidiphilus sp.]
MKKFLYILGRVNRASSRVLNRLQNVLLLAIRLYWGWQFAQDGWGKFTHLARVANYFGTLHLPVPYATAMLVSMVELIGGIFLALGLASRLTSLVLFVNMTVAYLAVPDDRVNFSHILSNPSDFYNATPFTYWFAALIILIFGAGFFAVDTVIASIVARRQAKASSPPPQTVPPMDGSSSDSTA